MYAKHLFEVIRDMLSQDYGDVSNIPYQLTDLLTGYGYFDLEDFTVGDETINIVPEISIGDVKDNSLGLLFTYLHPETGEILQEQKFMLSVKKYPPEKTYKEMIEMFLQLGGTKEQVFQNMTTGGFHFNDIQMDRMKTEPDYEARLDKAVADMTQAMFFYQL